MKTDGFCKLLKNKFLATQFVKEEDFNRYKLKTLENNFFEPMSPETKQEYEKGDGKELDKNMKSVRSSAVMIYNLLGNHNVAVGDNQTLPSGDYQKNFEYKLKTIKKSRRKANLDARLSNGSAEIFIESKCLEWIQNSHKKKLRRSYFDSARYVYQESAEVFINAGKQIVLSQYDSCQMFKHTLAIYNYLKENAIQNKQIDLVNVVWEPDPNELPEEMREQYRKQLNAEHNEFDQFHQTMQPVIDFIAADTKNPFRILYQSVKDFCSCLRYANEAQKRFIQRYL